MSEVSCASRTRLQSCKHIYNLYIYTSVYSIYKLRSLILLLPHLRLIFGKLQAIKKNITLKLPLNFVINLIFIAFPLAAANKSFATDIHREFHETFPYNIHIFIVFACAPHAKAKYFYYYLKKIYICNKIFLLLKRNLERRESEKKNDNAVCLTLIYPIAKIRIFIAYLRARFGNEQLLKLIP